MKQNKFIPLAVLAGLFITGFAMNNQQCAAEQSAEESKPACATKKCKDTTKPCNTKKSGRTKCNNKTKDPKKTKNTK